MPAVKRRAATLKWPAAITRSPGKAWTSEKNQNGVRTTQTNQGGEAKTEDGKGVVHGPGGTTCYRTANSHGCN